MRPTPKRVRATAPVRIADCGGWSDTWFAGHGEVCHVAVAPGIEVVVGAGDPPTDDFLAACLVEASAAPETAVEIVPTGIPLGAAVGTSASLAVAIIAAVDAQVGRRRSTTELARAAHRVETVQLGQQSGIQDQIAAAFGGINHVVMHRYPDSEVRRVLVSGPTWQALSWQLIAVYVGKPHRSSSAHETVIDAMERGDRLDALEPIRHSARLAVAALESGDLAAYGAALCLHHEAQRALHAGLVNDDVDRIVETARHFGALGWKVNGAGGEGGSVTILAGSDTRRLQRALGDAGYETLVVVPTRDGVAVASEGASVDR
jgi:D-glycero-alpha-D-manno-heptose-7-phosphate kinase